MNPSQPKTVKYLELEDNRLLPQLFGDKDRHLAVIEKELTVVIVARGNQLVITGRKNDTTAAQITLHNLYHRLKQGLEITEVDVRTEVQLARPTTTSGTGPFQESAIGTVRLETRKRAIMSRSPGQAEYLKLLKDHEMVFATGPAGTGKTYLAVATGVSMLLKGKVDRIILSRPAVEAGERLGFLPGNMQEKIDPYLRPLYDALFDMVPPEQVHKYMENDEIEVAPLAFMRGRTLSNSYVILDEAQNTTSAQMKMFLTRMGEGSYMVITGDLTQVDLPHGQTSGLRDAVNVLKDVPDIKFIHFDESDIVRHRIVTQIVNAYEKKT
ncbi:MAG: PhoH family protein [Pseudomonadota bacterium]